MKRKKNPEVKIGMAVNMAMSPSRDMLLDAEQCVRVRRDNALRLNYFLGSAATTVENLAQFAESVDVLIISGLSRELVRRFALSMTRRLPIVMLTYSPLQADDVAALGNCGSVVFSNAQIGKRAADFFIGHGLSNFAFIGRNGKSDDVYGGIRGNAFESRLRAVLGDHMTFSRLLVGICHANEDRWEMDAPARIRHWLKSLPLPCGILVNGGHVAYRLVEICRRMGIDVPGQIEVLGINNNDGFCEKARPCVSFVSPDLERGIEQAVELAVTLASGKDVPHEERFVQISSGVLFEGNSTDSRRGIGHIAVRANEYIRAHASEGIGVMDVAYALGVSRRTLEVRMREATGESVHGAIQAVRMRKVCHLLETTDLSITDVVMRAGYQPTKSPSVIFKRHFGMSMRDYRRMSRDKTV